MSSRRRYTLLALPLLGLCGSVVVQGCTVPAGEVPASPITGGPLEAVGTHGFVGTVKPGSAFTDAAEILTVADGVDAELVSIESSISLGDLEDLGIMVAGPNRAAATVLGVLDGWPARNSDYFRSEPETGEGAPIAQAGESSSGPAGTLLLIGYRLPDGVDVAARPEVIVTYRADGQLYVARREARMVVCNADKFTNRECSKKADELFPQG